MKRIDLIRHAELFDCRVVREGAKHSFIRNLLSGKTTSIPRHREINDFLSKKICKDLGIPKK